MFGVTATTREMAAFDRLPAEARAIVRESPQPSALQVEKRIEEIGIKRWLASYGRVSSLTFPLN